MLEKARKRNTLDSEAYVQGIEIDTGANKRYIMYTSQYAQCFWKLGLNQAIRSTGERRVRGIGGSRKSSGKDIIHIPAKDLGVMIDIHFIRLTGCVPTLLCNRDIYVETAWIFPF